MTGLTLPQAGTHQHRMGSDCETAGHWQRGVVSRRCDLV